jgi:hypothetical protein
MEPDRGTLVEPDETGPCSVCGSSECRRFHEAPYPRHYPFLPGGYEVGAVYGPPEPKIEGTRGRKLRCRS